MYDSSSNQTVAGLKFMSLERANMDDDGSNQTVAGLKSTISEVREQDCGVQIRPLRD